LADTCRIAKKPEPPKPTTWTIYNIAAKQTRLGTIEAPDQAAAVEKGRGGIQGTSHEADGNAAMTRPKGENTRGPFVFLTGADLEGEMGRKERPVQRRGLNFGPMALIAATFLMASRLPASAVDEIQLYNAEIAEVGQFTVEQHLNYTFIGRTTPDFPGGLIPNRTLNGTPEFAYGVTEWFELGLYIPWAIQGDGRVQSNNFKLRTLLVTPNADKKDFFYGLNFEYDFPNPKFDQNRFAMEIRPIIGWRNSEWEFIVNPIFDAGFGSQGYIDPAPAARLARKVAEDTFIGIEYYSDLGPVGSIPSFTQQQHQLFGVVDFKVGPVDVDFGVGYGLTPGSDRLVAKIILEYAFPVPGKSDSNDSSMKVTPTLRSVTRPTSNLQSTADPLQFLADPFFGMR
jgi:hypothetical protein